MTVYSSVLSQKSALITCLLVFVFSLFMSKTAVAVNERNFSDDEIAFLQKAERIQQAIAQKVQAKKFSQQAMKTQLPKKEIMSIEKARAEYGVDDWDMIDGEMLVFHGDVSVDGDINNSWIMEQVKGMRYENLYGMIVLGNLYVNGSIIDDDYLYVIVQKNTEADYIESHEGLMFFQGDLTTLYGIYGEYNDGAMFTNGKVYAPYLIASDHEMPRQAENESIYIEGGDGDDRQSIAIGKETGSGIAWSWYYYEPSAKLLSNKVWNQGTFSTKQFFDLVRNGENPFASLP